RHDSGEASVASLRTKMRGNPISWHPALFFSKDSHLRIRQSNLDLLGSHARQFDANDDFLFTFAEVNRRRPRCRSQRSIGLHSFLKGCKQTTNPVAQAL